MNDEAHWIWQILGIFVIAPAALFVFMLACSLIIWALRGIFY